MSLNRPLNRRVKFVFSIFNAMKKRDFKFQPVILSVKDIVIFDEVWVTNQLGFDGRITHAPGHIEDSVSLVMDNGNAFVGDAAMNFLNFAGTHHRPVWFYDMSLVLESWRKIIDAGAKEIYPAHGKHFPVESLKHYLTIFRRD